MRLCYDGEDFSGCDFLHSFVYCILSVFDGTFQAFLIKLIQTLLRFLPLILAPPFL